MRLSATGPGTRSGSAALGLAAARRAVTLRGAPPALRRPLIVQLVPPSNLAVGPVPWGLSPFVPADSYRQMSTATAARTFPTGAGLLAAADDRSLIIVVRDAHRHPAARQAVQLMLAGRPDAVVVEMGLPVWRADRWQLRGQLWRGPQQRPGDRRDPRADGRALARPWPRPLATPLPRLFTGAPSAGHPRLPA